MFNSLLILVFLLFFFNDTATTEIYTLSLHDALPIFLARSPGAWRLRVGIPDLDENPGSVAGQVHRYRLAGLAGGVDRKSTRLNSSHSQISYAVFCLKKKK